MIIPITVYHTCTVQIAWVVDGKVATYTRHTIPPKPVREAREIRFKDISVKFDPNLDKNGWRLDE